MRNRIQRRFARLKAEGRPALITYVMGGDPDHETSLAILRALPAAGSDVIELGMAFSDPLADGPIIQAAGLRALKSGSTLPRTLQLARAFRKEDQETPIVLMGYFNPVFSYGVERFLADGAAAGIDGLIIVDLPPEMDDELCIPAGRAGIDFIRMATPTSDAARLPAVLGNSSGFVYYVSMAGITGNALPDPEEIEAAVARIKRNTPLPVCVGFGIKTAGQARAVGAASDGIVVGTALVKAVTETLDPSGGKIADPVEAVTALVKRLAGAMSSVSRERVHEE